MTIVLHDVGGDGLLDILGKAFKSVDVINTSRLTTIPASLAAFEAQYKLKASPTPAMESAMTTVPDQTGTFQSNGSSIVTTISQVCQQLHVAFVTADTTQPIASLADSLVYLIKQMQANTTYVTPCVVGLSLAVGGSNTNDFVIAYSAKRGDGRNQENMLAEAIIVTCTDDTSPLLPTIQFTGAAAASTPLGQDWPAGSGLSGTVTPTDAGSSLLANGDFELTANNANIPDFWTMVVGTPGTTIFVTNPQIQTIAISGTPTGGTWAIKYTNPAGVVRVTQLLSFDAASTAVQAALRAIPGLNLVTVDDTGTTPNLTHAITMTGTSGNPTQFTSVSNLTGGAPVITHATPTPGDPGSYWGRSLLFTSNGAELTELVIPLNLSPETVYFCHFRTKRINAAAAGQVKVEIITGIGGAVVTDDQGNAAAITLTASAIATTFASNWFSFRIPVSVTQPVYLRIRISVAVTAAAKLYFDEMSIVAGSELYPGGPFVAVFTGIAPCIAGENWTLTATNDYAGKLQVAYNRHFAMANNRLLLPSSGVTLVPDSVIS